MLASNIAALSGPERDFARIFPGHRSDIWLDMARLWLNASGALLLATNALLEVEGLLGTDSTYPFPMTAPQLAAFITEAAGQQLVSAGHCLANIAIRLALEDSTAVWLEPVTGVAKRARRAIEHAEDGRDAFIFLSSLATVSNSLDSGVSVPFVNTVTRMSEAADWSEMHRQRDIYFHRIRDDFTRLGPESIEPVRSFHSTTVSGARCLGRTASPLYHQFLDAAPTSTPWGAAKMSHPLYGPILVADVPDGRLPGAGDGDLDFRPIIVRTNFHS